MSHILKLQEFEFFSFLQITEFSYSQSRWLRFWNEIEREKGWCIAIILKYNGYCTVNQSTKE